MRVLHVVLTRFPTGGQVARLVSIWHSPRKNIHWRCNADRKNILCTPTPYLYTGQGVCQVPGFNSDVLCLISVGEVDVADYPTCDSNMKHICKYA